MVTSRRFKRGLEKTMTNDDTNADSNDNATVLPSIAFAEKAGRPDPNSDIRLNPERERAFDQHRHA